MEKEKEPKKQGSENKPGIQEKLNETIESIKKNEKFEEVYKFAKSNTRDTIAYILLALALIMMLTIPFWGGLLIGLVGGIYFCEELVVWVRDINGFIERQGLSRSIVMGGVMLGFFLASPAIFIGAAVAIGIKRLVVPE